MTELENILWVEKYRPRRFEDLILEDKSSLLKYLESVEALPSFIFYSSKPGTGKTSTAKILINYLHCDSLIINSSDERGIDTIRDKIKLFVRTLSSRESVKKCIFLDEADGLTKPALDSLRNLMESYSANSFFIFSCNDVSKIIEPIRSRCVTINFDRPNKVDILFRLESVVKNESLTIQSDELEKMVDVLYPDIRSMILKLQDVKLNGGRLVYAVEEFEKFLDILKNKKVKELYDIVRMGNFPLMDFNNWLFERVFEKVQSLGLDKASRIVHQIGRAHV